MASFNAAAENTNADSFTSNGRTGDKNFPPAHIALIRTPGSRKSSPLTTLKVHRRFGGSNLLEISVEMICSINSKRVNSALRFGLLGVLVSAALDISWMRQHSVSHFRRGVRPVSTKNKQRI